MTSLAALAIVANVLIPKELREAKALAEELREENRALRATLAAQTQEMMDMEFAILDLEELITDFDFARQRTPHDNVEII